MGDAGLPHSRVQAGPVLRSGQFLNGEDGLDERFGQSFRRTQRLDPPLVVTAGPWEVVHRGNLPGRQPTLELIEELDEVSEPDAPEDFGVSESFELEVFHGVVGVSGPPASDSGATSAWCVTIWGLEDFSFSGKKIQLCFTLFQFVCWAFHFVFTFIEPGGNLVSSLIHFPLNSFELL